MGAKTNQRNVVILLFFIKVYGLELTTIVLGVKIKQRDVCKFQQGFVPLVTQLVKKCVCVYFSVFGGDFAGEKLNLAEMWMGRLVGFSEEERKANDINCEEEGRTV